jgi:putative flippase GtrA
MISTVLRIILKSARVYCTRELLFYLLFGGTAAFTSLFTGWVLYGDALFPWLPYWCATAAAATVGLVVNFVLNYFFNFKFRERTALQQFWTFCTVSGLGIFLTSFLSELLFFLLRYYIGNKIHLDHTALSLKFVANFIAVGLVVVYSFPAHRSISFNVGIGTRLRQLGVLLGLGAVGWPRAALKSLERFKS